LHRRTFRLPYARCWPHPCALTFRDAPPYTYRLRHCRTGRTYGLRLLPAHTYRRCCHFHERTSWTAIIRTYTLRLNLQMAPGRARQIATLWLCTRTHSPTILRHHARHSIYTHGVHSHASPSYLTPPLPPHSHSTHPTAPHISFTSHSHCPHLPSHLPHCPLL